MFCLGFCSIVWFFAPENGPKNSRHVRSAVFWGLFSLSLSLFFHRRRLFVFCCFQERKLRANRSHPTPHCFGLVFFSFFPRRTWFLTRFGRASFLSHVLSGCHSGPQAFFRCSWNLRGLSSLAHSEALFGREAARVFGFFSFVLFPCLRTRARAFSPGSLSLSFSFSSLSNCFAALEKQRAIDR